VKAIYLIQIAENSNSAFLLQSVVLRPWVGKEKGNGARKHPALFTERGQDSAANAASAALPLPALRTALPTEITHPSQIVIDSSFLHLYHLSVLGELWQRCWQGNGYT
jgi:hypothetical protein